jgi:hypothetical protein
MPLEGGVNCPAPLKASPHASPHSEGAVRRSPPAPTSARRENRRRVHGGREAVSPGHGGAAALSFARAWDAWHCPTPQESTAAALPVVHATSWGYEPSRTGVGSSVGMTASGPPSWSRRSRMRSLSMLVRTSRGPRPGTELAVVRVIRFARRRSWRCGPSGSSRTVAAAATVTSPRRLGSRRNSVGDASASTIACWASLSAIQAAARAASSTDSHAKRTQVRQGRNVTGGSASGKSLTANSRTRTALRKHSESTESAHSWGRRALFGVE